MIDHEGDIQAAQTFGQQVKRAAEVGKEQHFFARSALKSV